MLRSQVQALEGPQIFLNDAIMHTIKEYIRKCELCGKEFTQMISEYNILKGKERRFCSRSCANSRTIEHKPQNYKCISCGKVVIKDYRTDPRKILCDKCKSKQVERVCIICGKTFNPPTNKYGRLSKTSCCSMQCKKLLHKQNGLTAYNSAKEKGITKPRQSRNITSYPEKFWIEVLNNNNIKFEKEYFLNKKYFLDFYIEVNGRKIDLEIDGKQHTRQEHIEHDRIRDEYVTSNGIEVYRISWNEINSTSGKLLMKEKIDNFLIYYNELKTGRRE